MRTIHLSDWPRREHYNIFQGMDYPHFNICAQVDITDTLTAVKDQNLSLTITLVYILARAANEIVNFRYRIRGEKVVEHNKVHPSTTILTKGDLFSYCTIPYNLNYVQFAAKAAEQIDLVRSQPVLHDEPGQDDLLFLSSLPWVSFTGVSHPIHMHPVDSVPRITWGKFQAANGRMMMPLSVQVHHALADGYHVGQYYERVQDYLQRPDVLW